jgi:DNA-binding XRE family transcriptional regulator
MRAEEIIRFRNEKGISATQLASSVGLSRQTIYKMEKGESKIRPNVIEYIRLRRKLEKIEEAGEVLLSEIRKITGEMDAKRGKKPR